ncbi:ABC transporter ATP-binding protein [Mannheimia granulomatis]|uniref:Leukotoxin translocation ATP-binding protein LktB n=1 Tax=Mannheimia granulomatis TaxID=85402 RepID=A0A6G8JL06_9PAST|nr:ABC transporter ATP-binding protein [Mannheimia granulomatis]QIM67766.1 ABC transporter ATP-binding protein [Mannheimia granulomatis]
MSLSITNLSLGYEKNKQANTILQAVNFEVNSGTLTSILGPSGVGKSSLLRVVAGLDKPLSGQINLFGETINKPHPDVGFVFQSATLLPWLSVRNNVAFGLDFQCRAPLTKSDIQQRVESALEEVGLSHAIDAMPHELSGGMAQRVNLARALARKPKVILLDEPFSALDAVIRTQMQSLLHDIVRHHNAAALLVTHDIDEALLVSDNILLLGGTPAHIVGKWQLSDTFPRADLLSLNHVRIDILQSLRQAQQRNLQEQTVDFMI